MILLSCAKLPEGISKSELASLTKAKLPSKANLGYIDALEQKKNDLSACESLYALNLLCDMIACLPVPTSELILSRGKHGKPCFLNSTLKFNLSHSRGFVACAVSDSGEVGVDVEATLPPPDRAKKLAERFFDPKGRKAVENDPSLFARLWSEKEATSKFFGENLSEFLENEQKLSTDGDNTQENQNVSLHRFSFCKIPVTLCTTRDFSTITFTCST